MTDKSVIDEHLQVLIHRVTDSSDSLGIFTLHKVPNLLVITDYIM